MKTTRLIIGQLVFVWATCVVIVVAAGGIAFLLKPIGALYLVLWTLWWLATALGRYPGEPSGYDRKQRAAVIVISLITVPLLVLGPPWEYAHYKGPIPRDGPLAWVGLVLFSAGIALQSAAMRELRGAYTVRLSVLPEHRLVTTGPYGLVRHPGYLSYILSLAGIGLALSSLVGLSVAILVVPFLVWRIKAEEQMLLDRFGEDYRGYMRRTRWRLVPLFY